MKVYEIRQGLAERGGFEPPVAFLTLRRFSKPLLSTTQPPLRVPRISCNRSMRKQLLAVVLLV
jgi:hypothetical protein